MSEFSHLREQFQGRQREKKIQRRQMVNNNNNDNNSTEVNIAFCGLNLL